MKAGEVEAAKVNGRTAAAGLLAGIGLGRSGVDLVGVEANLVVHLALLLVAENVVGFRDFLELLLGLFVARIDVGMIFAREFAEGLADVIRSGRLLDAEQCVIVFVLRCGHVRFLISVSRTGHFVLLLHERCQFSEVRVRKGTFNADCFLDVAGSLCRGFEFLNPGPLLPGSLPHVVAHLQFVPQAVVRSESS